MKIHTRQEQEALDKVREALVLAAREAIDGLNAFETLTKEPSRRQHYSLNSQTAVQRERDLVTF